MYPKPGIPSFLLWIVGAGVGLVLLLGGCLREDRRVEEGRRLFEQARFRKAEEALAPLFEGTSLPADRTALLYGRVLLARGELTRARDVYGRLLDRSPTYRNDALYGLARTHFYLGHPDTARSMSRRLLRRASPQQESGKPVRAAQAHHVLGRTDFYEAHYDRALMHQRKSLRWARRADSSITVEARADALRQIGVLYWYRGRVDSARTAFYEPALSLYRQVGDSSGVATILSNIGLLHWQKGEWRKHARYQLRAFAMRKRMGDQIGLADSYAFLAGIPEDVGLQNAGYQIRYLRESLALSRRIGYAWGEEVASQRMQNVFGTEMSYWESSLFRPQDTTIQLSGEHRFLRQLRTAQIARHNNEWSRAERLFAKAHRIADSLGYYNFQRSTLLLRSRALVRRRRMEEAEALLRKVEAMEEEGARPWTRDHTTLLRARIALQRGELERAEGLLRPLAAKLDRRYLNALHETAPEVAIETAAGVVHGRRASVYSRLVDALQRRRGDDAFRVLERERALPFWGGRGGGEEGGRQVFGRLVRRLERLDQVPGGQEERVQDVLTTLGEIRQAQLAKRRLLDRSGPGKQELEVTSREELRGALRREEVFVEYIIGGKKHHVFVARPDSSQFFTISVPRDTIATTIDVYRSTLQRGREHPAERLWRSSGQHLFEILLRPLLRQGWIQAGDHLLIAPHRRLWSVPFHALPYRSDGNETHFLLERNPVSYVRSGTDLVEQRHRSPRPLRTALAVAPAPDALPHTKRELDHVRDASFEQTRVLEGSAAQKETVREAWGKYDVVHLAAHARTNAQFPLYSPLELRDEPLELYEILEQAGGGGSRLVVLSACETGRNVGATGQAPTGTSVIGFPHAFLRAGAGSVVGTLWRVDDAATAQLMELFYRELAASNLRRRSLSSARSTSPRSLVDVLTRAQRTYLERARQSDRPTHPFFWAGFALTGDGR